MQYRQQILFKAYWNQENDIFAFDSSALDHSATALSLTHFKAVFFVLNSPIKFNLVSRDASAATSTLTTTAATTATNDI